MNSVEIPLLTVPLDREVHTIAEQFAAEQATPQKGKRVYLNTLAVYAVHNYLRWLQIETALSHRDSWYSSLQAVFDVATLLLPGVGKLECRPVLPGETTFSVSPMTEDRIGYVAVQFSECLDTVQLLGFIPAINAPEQSEQLPIANLQPLDTLLDYIPEEIPLPTANNQPINLSLWFEKTFEAGWQTVEALLGTQATNLAFSVRSTYQLSNPAHPATGVTLMRGKLIDLGIQQTSQPLALIVTLTPETSEEVNICLQVHPTGEQLYLPPNLQLIVLDESGATCMEATASSADNWLQQEFSGQPQERFSVKVALGDVSITENFVI